LEWYICQEINYLDTLWEHTTTPIERPLTVTQEKNQWLTLQEILKNVREKETEEKSLVSESLLPEFFKALLVSQKKISNFELYAVLLALVRNSNPQPKRKYCTIRELDLFSKSDPDKL